MDSYFGDGANNNIGWGAVYKCESGDCAVATATLNGGAFTTIASGATTNIVLRDQNSDTITPDSVVGTTITVSLGSTPVGATLLKTGQTTSYRTGDDGDLEEGRATSFSVLAENNPFGNTNRFTDELGGQTYTNNIVIDWSTYDGSSVLGFRTTRSGTVNWNGAIDGALAVSIGSYTTGWRLPNVHELFNLSRFATSWGLNYAPFSFNDNDKYWTSTTWYLSGTDAYAFDNTYSSMMAYGKTTNLYYIPCRTFTVVGTNLS